MRQLGRGPSYSAGAESGLGGRDGSGHGLAGMYGRMVPAGKGVSISGRLVWSWQRRVKEGFSASTDSCDSPPPH